jgi:hypothetical protein
MGASVASVYTGELGSSASDGSKEKPWATAGPASRAGALVSGGKCDHPTPEAVPNRLVRSGRGDLNGQVLHSRYFLVWAAALTSCTIVTIQR